MILSLNDNSTFLNSENRKRFGAEKRDNFSEKLTYFPPIKAKPYHCISSAQNPAKKIWLLGFASFRVDKRAWIAGKSFFFYFFFKERKIIEIYFTVCSFAVSAEARRKLAEIFSALQLETIQLCLVTFHSFLLEFCGGKPKRRLSLAAANNNIGKVKKKTWNWEMIHIQFEITVIAESLRRNFRIFVRFFKIFARAVKSLHTFYFWGGSEFFFCARQYLNDFPCQFAFQFSFFFNSLAISHFCFVCAWNWRLHWLFTFTFPD